MFKVTAKLSNARPAKTTTPELVLTPSFGGLKINTLAARLLGVVSGDYLNVVEGEVDGQRAFYVHASNTHGVGSKLAASGDRGTGMLCCSSSNVWNLLGGSTDERKVFEVSSEGVQEHEGIQYFPVMFLRAEPKAERKTKATV